MSDPSSNPTGTGTGTGTDASTSDAYNADALGSINLKMLASDTSGSAQSFPSVTLASGQTLRTGTVAMLLHNIRLYDAAAAAATEDRQVEMAALEREMRLAVPTLEAIGIFDLFAPDEWVHGPAAGPGRKMVGEMAREMGFAKK